MTMRRPKRHPRGWRLEDLTDAQLVEVWAAGSVLGPDGVPLPASSRERRAAREALAARGVSPVALDPPDPRRILTDRKEDRRADEAAWQRHLRARAALVRGDARP